MKRFLFLLLMLTGMLHAARLDFPELIKEVHAPADAKTVAVDFKFSNRSDKPVTIIRYDAACSCMSVQISDGKMTYAPGESGVVRANFDMGNFSGDVEKVVMLWLDGDPVDKPSLQLKTQVHIPVMVSIEPKTLKWDMGTAPQAQIFQIRMNDEKPIKILNVTASTSSFEHELKTVEDGKHYELKITPVSTESSALTIFRITTDCAVERHRTQQAFAIIRKATAAEAPPQR